MTTTPNPVTATAGTAEARWQQSAACTSVDPEIFFPTGFGGRRDRAERKAKKVCARCPVWQQCLDWAVQTRPYAGVWGGTSEEERRDLYEAPEKVLNRCLEAQEWIEAKLAEGWKRKTIALELGVDSGGLSRALKHMQRERENLTAAGMEKAA